jgi:hypothetical protein
MITGSLYLFYKKDKKKGKRKCKAIPVTGCGGT